MVDELAKRFKQGKLGLRTLSAIVLMPLVLYLVYCGDMPYKIALSGLSGAMMWEWIKLTHSAKNRLVWWLFGVVYTVAPCYVLFLLREAPEGTMIVFWLLSCVWATDIGAYFAGITVGGPKIMPAISANKTWAGLVGAIISSLTVGYIYIRLAVFAEQAPYLYMSGIIPIVAQIGDFFESAIKRYFKVKDSGSIIPGHGGFLDRLDGLITASIFVWATMKCLEMV